MLILDPHSATEPDAEVLASSQLSLKMGGKLLPWPPGKTKVAIGSSPRCEVRIQAPGVQPLHCLVDVKADTVHVRRWSGEAFINGQHFDESPLKAGDQLRIGQVEIDVVAPPPGKSEASSSAPLSTPGASFSTDDSSAGRVDVPTSDEQLLNDTPREVATNEESLQLVSTLQEKVAQAQREQADAIEELRHVQTEFARLQHEASELKTEHSKLAEKVESLISEREATAAALAQCEEHNATLASQNQQLLEELSHVKQESDVLSRQVNFLGDERDGLREQLAKLQEELRSAEEEKARLAHALTAASAEREELWRQQKQLQSDLQDRLDELTALSTQNQQVHEELSRARQEIDDLLQRASTLGEERDGLREQVAKLQGELGAVDEQRAALAESLTATAAQRDELCLRYEQLQSDLQQHHDELAAQGGELAAIRNEHEHLREQYKQLQLEARELNDRSAALAEERAALASECETLRQKVHRLDELECQMRQAVTERENTSAELYRALLQLAEMQERDDQHLALVAAHQALKEELEKNVAEIARLQQKIDQQLEEHAAIEDVRKALLAQITDLTTAQGLLSTEKDELAARLAEAREEVSAVSKQRDELSQQLTEVETVRRELVEAQHRHQELIDSVARLERELAEALDRELAQSHRITELELQLASAETATATASVATVSLPSTAQNERVMLAEIHPFSTLLHTEPSLTAVAEPSSGETSSVTPTSTGNARCDTDPAASFATAPSSFAMESELGQRADSGDLKDVFVDRVSPVLEDTVNESPPIVTGAEACDHPLFARSTHEPDRSSQHSNADEESLEEYVAKLLQRIRGESVSTSSPSQSTVTEPTSVISEEPLNFPKSAAASPSNIVACEEVNVGTPDNEKKELVRRRPTSLESTADLAALRTLANESARRAITTHTLRKHRHNAVTRITLAVVAGMAGWWFLFQAKDWGSLNFIAGCVSLLAAAYWIGETLRTVFLLTCVVATHRWNSGWDRSSDLTSAEAPSEGETHPSELAETLNEPAVGAHSAPPQQDLELDLH